VIIGLPHSKNMTSLANEHALIAATLALIGESVYLSAAEQRLAARNKRIPTGSACKAIRAAIMRGEDPLGDALMILRPPALRRATGAVYTPVTIIASMLDWAASEGRPARVIDPGAGSGRFLIAAAARFPRAELLAIEVDPVAALTLRANLAVHGLAERAAVLVATRRTSGTTASARHGKAGMPLRPHPTASGPARSPACICISLCVRSSSPAKAI
jgi:hypothetical protein